MTPPAVLTRWQLPAVTSGVTRAECRDHAQTEAKPCMSLWQRGFCTFLPEYPRRQQIWALSVLQSTQQARCSWPAAVLRAGRDTGTRLPVCWCKNLEHLELWTSESYCSEIQGRQEDKKDSQLLHLTWYQARSYLCGPGRARGLLGGRLPCSCWIHPKIRSWLLVGEEKPSCSFPLPARGLCSSISAERGKGVFIRQMK